MSAVQFQRQLGLSRYETAFQILHKLRSGMVRPNQDRIGGQPKNHVEVDETWVGGRTRGEGRGVHHKVDEFGDPVGQPQQQPIATEAEAMEVAGEFIRNNPIVEDPAIHDGMLQVAAAMTAQGLQPDLATMLQHAVARDPRYSRQAQEAEHLARAREGTGQVSGGATVTPSAKSDDIGDILDQLIPRD